MDCILEAKKVFNTEICALNTFKDCLDNNFKLIVDRIFHCKGKVVLSGMGKSGHIARKIAATFSSLGTPSFFLHSAEALHGDLGMITKEDIVILISFSGESEEVIKLIHNIKIIGAPIIGITGKKDSQLNRYSEVCQVLPQTREACHLELAPTSSTTSILVYGDALAVVVAELKGFDRKRFALYHPAGSLGKKLVTRVKDVMSEYLDTAIIEKTDSLQNAVIQMCCKESRIISVVDNETSLYGILTDGDIRRLIEKQVSLYDVFVEDIVIKSPKTTRSDALAVDALIVMRDNNITAMPVVDNRNHLIGTISIQNILQAGIII